MESSSGNARLTPMPRRNVLRGRCFLVTNMVAPPAGSVSTGTPQRRSSAGRHGGQLLRIGRRRLLHLERDALHDAEHDRRPAIVAGRGLSSYLPHERSVVELDTAAEP